VLSNTSRSLLRAACVVALTGAAVPVASCAGPQKVPSSACELTQKVGLIIKSSPRLNEDDEARSLPTIIRIYQLKSPNSLENAQFEDIWKKDKETLGEDLLQKDEVVMYPDRITKKEFTRDPKANVVAAVVIVRHPSGISWRTEFELPPPPGEQRCQKLQEDPTAGATATENPQFYLLMEDYRVEPGDDTFEEEAARRARNGGRPGPGPNVMDILQEGQDLYDQGRVGAAQGAQQAGEITSNPTRALTNTVLPPRKP